MKIVLLSKSKFLIDELNKLDEEIVYIKEIDELFSNILDDEEFLFFQHLDFNEDFSHIYSLVLETYPRVKFIALRNKTDHLEGCGLLKKSYKAYIHALSNKNIFNDVINSVKKGNIWVYPELMQFMINNISSQDEQNINLFKDLSPKELEVLKLVAKGLSNNEISKILDIATITVKKHISSLFKKLNVSDRLALALLWKNTL